MTIAFNYMTLEEYLNDENGSDTRYELVNGELVVMPPESDLNQRIVSFLFIYFAQLGIPPHRLRIGLEIVVSGARATTRLPDLVILSEELTAALVGAKRATVLSDMPPPLLVVEIVSSGKENADRDYRFKRSEYAARGILEYWIVDPIQQKITVLTWESGFYEEQVFQEKQQMISSLFPDLQLNALQVLTGEMGNS